MIKIVSNKTAVMKSIPEENFRKTSASKNFRVEKYKRKENEEWYGTLKQIPLDLRYRL